MRARLFACLLACLPGTAAAGPVEFRLTDAHGQAVPDAVVSLVPLDAPVHAAPPAAPVEISQQHEEFIPYVTAVLVGTAVNFPNRDTVQHHVYSLSRAKKFELPLYAGESKEAIVFDRPGVVALGCNIHDWMAAYVVVLDTPWFARTGADGAGTVADVPAGRYRAEVWHPRLARIETRAVTVAAAGGAPLAFTLTLKPDRRIHRTPGHGGGGYQ